MNKIIDLNISNSFFYTLLFLILGIAILFPELSEAATSSNTTAVQGDEQFKKAFEIISGLLGGFLGKLFAIGCFIYGLYRCVRVIRLIR